MSYNLNGNFNLIVENKYTYDADVQNCLSGIFK